MSGPDYGGLPRELRTVAWRQAARRPSLCALVSPQPPQEYEYEDRSRQESRYGRELQNRAPATVFETTPCGNCSYGKQPQRDEAIGLTEGTTRIKAARISRQPTPVDQARRNGARPRKSIRAKQAGHSSRYRLPVTVSRIRRPAFGVWPTRADAPGRDSGGRRSPLRLLRPAGSPRLEPDGQNPVEVQDESFGYAGSCRLAFDVPLSLSFSGASETTRYPVPFSSGRA